MLGAPNPQLLSKVLTTLAIPPEAREKLEAYLSRVEVDPEAPLVILYFLDQGDLEDKWLKALEEALSQILTGKPPIKAVREQTRGQWQERLQGAWPALREKLGEAFPFLQGSLGEIGYQIEGDDLIQVRVPSPFLARFLREKKSQLETFLSGELAVPLRVAVRVLEDAGQEQWEAVRQRREEEEQRYLAQILLQQEKTGESQLGTPSIEELPTLLLGKPISREPIPIRALEGEEKDVVIEGKVFQWESREVKGGRFLLSLVLTDRRDSIGVKLFTDKDKLKILEEFCRRHDVWYKVEGATEEDRYTREIVCWAKSVLAMPAPLRVDREEEKRVELHLHTQMSALDATIKLEELFRTLKRWGHKAVAITDHGVIQAYPEAYLLGEKHDIKVLYGLEGYLVEKGEEKGKAYHVILLVKNQEGLRDLYQLVTSSHLEFFHRFPRIPREELVRFRENLLVGSACEAGELIQAYLQGKRGPDLERIASFYDYLEIQPWANNAFLIREGKIDKEGLLALNRDIYQLGKKLGKPVVATGDVHFLEPEDEVLRCILMTAQGYSDAEHQPPLFFRTTGEMLEEFSYLGPEAAREVVVENPQKLAHVISEVKPIPDGLHAPQIPGAEEQIREMAYRKAENLYGNPLPEVVEKRIRRELEAIIDNGFAVIYLIAHKLVRKSLTDGYLVGSRGSVGSSFVATLCGITEVNPLPPHYRCPNCRYTRFVSHGKVGCGFDLGKETCPQCSQELETDGHNIPFEVFMGFEGDKVPDIDLNFSGEYQSAIHRYTEDLFGSERVFRAGTISTIAARTAYGFVKGYLNDKGIRRREVEVERLVKECTGIKRTTGQHPGGLMVLPENREIAEFTPLQYPADSKGAGVVTTHFDYHSISSRLLKLDLLGHDDPTTLRMLSELTGVDVPGIPFDDPETMAIFSGLGNLGLDSQLFEIPIGTIGIPEFGTRFVRQMLADTKPSTFAELVRISGLSHGTDVWLNNAQELVRSGTAVLGEVISTRDDIMTYLMEKGVPAKQAFSIMERVRKGKGLKGEDREIMESHRVPQWYIDSCQKIKYMFPKAHAVAYVMMAFRIAYFKVHYPQAFYATYFSVKAADFDVTIAADGIEGIRRRIAEIDQKGNDATPKEKGLIPILEVAMEMYARGFRFRSVDLQQSDSTRFLITPTGLLPPFLAMPGVGQSVARNIVVARKEAPFTSVEDLQLRARLSKKVIDTLQNNGCLQGMPETDQLLLFGE